MQLKTMSRRLSEMQNLDAGPYDVIEQHGYVFLSSSMLKILSSFLIRTEDL